MISLFPSCCPSLTGGYDRFLQWGVSASSGQGFWLRQLDVRRPLLHEPRREVALAVFCNRTRQVSLICESESFRPQERRRWQQGGCWDTLHYNWGSGSFARQSGVDTNGRLFSSRGAAHWRLSGWADPILQDDLAWPGGALRSRGCVFSGRVEVPGLLAEGSFQGAVMQSWGKLTVPGLAQVSCTQFTDAPEARFSLVAQSLDIAWPGRDPLGIAVAELRDDGEQHRFERWLPAPTIDAPRLDRYRWMGSLVNKTHRLEVVADGGSPRVNAWLGLPDLMPGGGHRLLRMTPFASLRLRLFARGSQTVLKSWRSEQALLMTHAGDDAALTGKLGYIEP